VLLNRREIHDLHAWARSKNRKPLVIRGARQVGKSTLVRRFAELAQLPLVEINFERNPELKDAFATRDPRRILTMLRVLTEQEIPVETSLLFLDEIQVAPEALVALRYFHEEMPQLHVVAAGSLLEFTLADAEFSMPVGRVEYMHLGPMQFEDFLRAMKQEAFATWLQEISLAQLSQGSMVPALHEKGLDWLRQYSLVGGMPEAGAQVAEHGDFKAAAQIQQGIVATYRDDFGKYSHGTLKARMQLVFDRLPGMVGRKFKYVQVSDDHRAAELAAALQQLCMARTAYKVPHTAANGVPLSAESNRRHFKALCMDVGLMCRSLHLDLADLTKTDMTLINSGAVAEQFIGQHLLYSGAPYDEPTLNYWMREGRNASAAVDYVLAQGQNIVPIEIKAGKAGTMRSLHYFLKGKQRRFGLRFNSDVPSLMRNAPLTVDSIALQYDLLSLPLYMVGQARRLLTEYFNGARSRG
jgi:predicted AAA+ superfamily ATPase